MALSNIQREGTVKFGTDAGSLQTVSSEVFACTLKRTFDAVEVKGTFADSRNKTYPGNYQDELTVKFANDGGTGASTLSGLISEAVFAATPSTILYFEFIQDASAVGASNQRFTGSVSVLEAMKGGEVGSLREDEHTFPVLTLTRAAS